jgi:hypothetical protein
MKKRPGSGNTAVHRSLSSLEGVAIAKLMTQSMPQGATCLPTTSFSLRRHNSNSGLSMKERVGGKASARQNSSRKNDRKKELVTHVDRFESAAVRTFTRNLLSFINLFKDEVSNCHIRETNAHHVHSMWQPAIGEGETTRCFDAPLFEGALDYQQLSTWTTKECEDMFHAFQTQSPKEWRGHVHSHVMDQIWDAVESSHYIFWRLCLGFAKIEKPGDLVQGCVTHSPYTS